MNKIGLYIKQKRKETGLTQSQLAEMLNISFQSVSKWEVGEALPDTSILLDLCNALDVTADSLLCGGVVVGARKRLVLVESIVKGFEHLQQAQQCFGKDSPFYQAIAKGISQQMNFDFEDALENNVEVLYTEVVLHYLAKSYVVDVEEAKKFISNAKYIAEIEKRVQKG